MGIRGRKPKPIKNDGFINYAVFTDASQLVDKTITQDNLFPYEKYDEGFSYLNPVTAETVTDSSTQILATTFSSDYLMTNAFITGINIAGTMTYMRATLIIVRGNSILFRLSGYFDTNNILVINMPVNNFLIKSGDSLRLEKVRTNNASDYKISYGITVINISK